MPACTRRRARVNRTLRAGWTSGVSLVVFGRGVAAPDNIILIGGPCWSQQIGAAATDPFEGKNLAYVGYICPITDANTWSDTGVMAQVAPVRPLMITEWGFRDAGEMIWGATKTSFGEPLKAKWEDCQEVAR